LPERPGVYRMMNARGDVIYVGKAKNLKKRVKQYFTKALDIKTQAMVSLINSIEVTITSSEVEALLLENNLIKKIKPKYNIQFKDDKSYPVIVITDGDDFPSINYHVGKINKKSKNTIYGPFPDRYSAKSAVELIQKTFKIRNCSNSFFRNRSRPCLQYEIKRCDAPCVDLITKEDYLKNIKKAKRLLDGKTEELLRSLTLEMQELSNNYAYEKAAVIRDQISNIRSIQTKQSISTPNKNHLNLDIIGFFHNQSKLSIHVLKVRDGLIVDTKNHIIDTNNLMTISIEEYIEKFILHYYAKGLFTSRLIVPQSKINIKLIEEYLLCTNNISINICYASSKSQKDWVNICQESAKQALKSEGLNKDKNTYAESISELSRYLDCEFKDFIITCFDVSHNQGSSAIAAAISFDVNGPKKQLYRFYNIKQDNKRDDYASLNEAVERFLKNNSQVNPSIILIDGGKGQLSAVQGVLKNLQSKATILGISKGEKRKSGLEKIWIAANSNYYTIELPDKAFWFLIQVRDEAHRFAISKQRKKDRVRVKKSELTEIEGIGEKLRQNLILHFGGIERLKKATISDISNVQGISNSLANRIFNFLHGINEK
jgi:excinuclease ABC subunit C